MNNQTHDDRRVAPGAAVLWASAFVILAMILAQASRLGAPAYAGDVSTVGDFTILTAAAGNSEDILLALDPRSDRVLVYGILRGQSLDFRGSYELSELFQSGRGGGTQRRSR